jgi:hypothetical protein
MKIASHARWILAVACFSGIAHATSVGNFSGAAHATSVGNWHELHADNGVLAAVTFNSKTYNLAKVSPTLNLDDEVWLYTGNLAAQSPSQIAEAVIQQFDLAADSLTTVAYCNAGRRGSCSTGASTSRGFTWSSGPTSSFTAGSDFDYLAINLGLAELLFHWSVPIDSFVLSGLPALAVSNYRAYLSPQLVATPLPAAALLFASGLAGVAALARRRGGSAKKAPTT